MKHPEMRIGYC